MANRQYYGLKFPCTTEDNENYYLDVSKTVKDKVRGMLIHLFFTPKKQRIRNPEFGTDLVKYIFEMNDTSSWGEIKSEIQERIKNYISNVTVNDINVLKNEDDEHEIYVRIDYTIQNGNDIVTDSIVTQV